MRREAHIKAVVAKVSHCKTLHREKAELWGPQEALSAPGCSSVRIVTGNSNTKTAETAEPKDFPVALNGLKRLRFSSEIFDPVLKQHPKLS